MKQSKFMLFDKRFWLDLLAPNRCAFCNGIIEYDKVCCEDCREKLPYIDKELCDRCGKAECMCNENISYDGCVSVVWYDESMVSPVVRFKTKTPDNFSQFFAKELYKLLNNRGLTDFDLVTCTPSTKSKIKEKGFNQAAVLGGYIAKEMNLPFDDKVLVKYEDGGVQHTLNRQEREKNADKAFGFNSRKDVKGKKILLCDDIITPGSTFNACARILKERGAELVVCAAACNTCYKNETV